ncbi:4-alpha-glucanotransferase [Lignipirellula cremea]|uniref:4-alpha-glucanotransferase n=2 Tax=Lignipirellula cremea TaxID=2528010 RepID=A0A518DMX0_9BACT|nr:4-alpha-glucanotransferase [Lignipirellula cremea]
MGDDSRPAMIPFQPDDRASGLLLHVTSLPCRFGIGDLGPAACDWIDQLQAAGQKCWQILPLGPTGEGFSPYTPTSTFAGNIWLISPDRLMEDGLLTAADCQGADFPADHIAFDEVRAFKRRLLDTAWRRFVSDRPASLQEAFEQFRQHEQHWLDDFALFTAIKAKFGDSTHYQDWPKELVRRDAETLASARSEMAEAIDACCFEQFLFFRQGRALKDHAQSRGVAMLGDVPFFISADSADVWSNPELFLLDEHQRPLFVAGVPPDYFSADGQLWGNPVYDWNVLQRTGYRWWVDRLRALLAHVDVLRLDHFRAFAAAWHTPAGAETAIGGEWRDGPGSDFFAAISSALGGLPFVAEDLGHITDDVRELRKAYHLPGMMVLQFAFDGDPLNPFLPEHCTHNNLSYTGTHDNNTTRGWYESLNQEQQNVVWQMLHRDPVPAEEVAGLFLETAWHSSAALAMAPLQDLLNLGSEARMNTPGIAAGNWGWRCTPEQLQQADFARLRELTAAAGRLP